jgi:hypothetical protein
MKDVNQSFGSIYFFSATKVRVSNIRLLCILQKVEGKKMNTERDFDIARKKKRKSM